MKSMYTILLSFLGIAIFALTGCGPKYTIEEQESVTLVLNKGGKPLGTFLVQESPLLKKAATLLRT